VFQRRLEEYPVVERQLGILDQAADDCLGAAITITTAPSDLTDEREEERARIQRLRDCHGDLAFRAASTSLQICAGAGAYDTMPFGGYYRAAVWISGILSSRLG